MPSDGNRDTWHHCRKGAEPHHVRHVALYTFSTAMLLALFHWSFVRKTYTWWSPKSSQSWFHEIQWILCRFHEIWWISHEIQWISCGFHEIWQISCRFHVKSTWKPYKSKNSRKTSVSWSAVGRLCLMISHEIRNERPTIARNGKAYVFLFLMALEVNFPVQATKPVFWLGLFTKIALSHNIISMPWQDPMSSCRDFFHENHVACMRNIHLHKKAEISAHL